MMAGEWTHVRKNGPCANGRMGISRGGEGVKSLRTKTISNKDHFVQGRPFRTKA